MSKALVIGGGIVGLSSALYLRESGWEVRVLDKGDFGENCSYGNCGYICPSHFVPLATPGIVKQGLKWMLNSESPFYIQPRLDLELIRWGLAFMRSATAQHVERSAQPLLDISLFSQREYLTWIQERGFNFSYEHKGLLEIFQTAGAKAHAEHTVEKAHAIGLVGTRILIKDELDAFEPGVRMNAIGALYFDSDAHCYPNQLMANLISHLRNTGVQLEGGKKVTGFELGENKINKVFCAEEAYTADEIVLATGSWGAETARLLDIDIPMMPGRGYSFTLDNSPLQLTYPSVLVEGRVATTPMAGNKMRFGGTMEITSHATPPRMNRVQGIVKAVKRYYPDYDLTMPAKEDIWYGYRPCSADGLPYIGRVNSLDNLILATGHAMIGLSLGAGTGKLVAEIISGKTPSLSLAPFAVERFQRGKKRRRFAA